MSGASGLPHGSAAHPMGAPYTIRSESARTFVSTDTCVIEKAVAFAADRLRRQKISADAVAALELAVMEAVGNVVRHAQGEACEFSIAVSRRRNRAVVEVLDHGPGFQLRPSRMPHPFAEGGRGVPLMQRLCDSVEYSTESGGNRLVLVKSIAPAPG